MQHELILVGGGSGTREYLLPAAKQALEEVDCVIASQRFLRLITAKKTKPMTSVSELIEKLPEWLEQESIGIVVSGDPLMYSLCRSILNRYPKIPMRVIPGVGSLQLLGAAFGLTMEDAAILSIHGRDCTDGAMARTVSENAVTFFFCSKSKGPKEIASALLKYGLEETELFVGADLTYPEQWLWHGKPSEFEHKDNPSLCTAAVKNKAPRAILRPALLPDSAFLRNSSPMTKEEVRAVIISKLRLSPDSVVWDIGAGTGSISVECARACPFGSVYAVEYKEAALEILNKNKEYFQTTNLSIVPGRAEQEIEKLPMPDCVFIGGSGGAMAKLIETICALDKRVRLVVSAVTLETQAELYPLLANLPQFEVVQLAVSRGKQIGSYNVLNGNNPVMLFSCETKE